MDCARPEQRQSPRDRIARGGKAEILSCALFTYRCLTRHLFQLLEIFAQRLLVVLNVVPCIQLPAAFVDSLEETSALPQQRDPGVERLVARAKSPRYKPLLDKGLI